MLTKSTAICNMHADIVFLSDIRLGNKFKKFTDAVRMDYKFVYNSTGSKRGVGILIKNNLDIIILDTYKDVNENIILLRCQLIKSEVIVGSVYGPNTNNDSFFRDLNTGLESFPRVPIILGGDWNATNSMDPLPDNPDCFMMQDIPSLHRSRELNTLKDTFDLIDPFRILNPLLIDYTYEPHGTVRKNRSRIDFFLTSGNLLESIKSSEISSKFCKKLFDHRSVTLNFGKKKKVWPTYGQ